jgi:hypothetical protein
MLVVWLYQGMYGVHFLFQVSAYHVGIVTGIIFCAKPSNILIRYLFDLYSIQIPYNEHEVPEQGIPKAGRLIGIIERVLTFSLIVIGQFQAAGLIITAKSILRFNTIKKNEYVLVGTLLSFGIAIFCGLLIRLI